MRIYSVRLEESHSGLIWFATNWHTTPQAAIAEAVVSRPGSKDEDYEDDVVDDTLIIDPSVPISD